MERTPRKVSTTERPSFRIWTPSTNFASSPIILTPNMETSAVGKSMSSPNLEPIDFTGPRSTFSAIPISMPPTTSLKEHGEISSRISLVERLAGPSKKTGFSFLETIREIDKSSARHAANGKYAGAVPRGGVQYLQSRPVHL